MAAAEPSPAPSHATDRSPIEIESELAEEGRDATFAVLPGARIRCATCGAVTDAARQSADHVERTEGASDPADMTLVVPISCPECGARGSLTLSYGPGADPDAADLVASLPRHSRSRD
jgi:hypothetical protein